MACGFVRIKFRGDFWLRMSSIMPQRLPATTIIVPMSMLFTGRNLLDTRLAFVITYLTFTLLLAV